MCRGEDGEPSGETIEISQGLGQVGQNTPFQQRIHTISHPFPNQNKGDRVEVIG